MRAVDLNFAGTPFRNNTPYYLGYGLGAAFLVAFTLYNVMAFHTYSQDNAQLEQNYATSREKLESLRREATDLQAKIDKADLGSLNGRAAFTNGLLERRRFSWTDLLNSLEEAQVYQVRLLSLLPRIQEKGILIDARAVAHDLKSMWNFQQNLQNHPKFRRVYPGGWTKSTEEGEIVFNIAFNYFPQGAPEGVQGITPQEAGMQSFTEAPGIGEGGGDEAANQDEQEAVPEEPPAPRKAPSTATAKPKGSAPTPGGRGAVGGAANAAKAADPRGEKSRAAVDAAADLAAADSAAAAGAPAQTPVLRGGFGPPVGSTGANGATGTDKPGRHVGRGLPPGSNGVRPPPPPKPKDLPTVPVNGGKDDPDGGDDQ